nr:DUF4389 domain-containing protein [Nocardia xishanensis]
MNAVDKPRYPVALRGDLDGSLSRWRWLVKWLLAIPHYLVLIVLWIGFVAATLAAGIAIVCTGRYPRSLFDFNVGVLRWNWRVQFYTYAALGTDRYPPFTLGPADYPADLQVEYPERSSRWQPLVKWWLLAIPHYLVIAAMTTAGPNLETSQSSTGGGTIGLLGVLVLIAAVTLLSTGRYPRPLFDFVMGVNRWLYRVIAYVALMRDEYPPFRLDQGPREEPATTTG